MASKKFTFNNINYTIKDDVAFISGTGKLTNTQNTKKIDGISKYGIDKLISRGTIFPVINALDIDWNSAEVENTITLNTTSDLLNWIKGKFGSLGNISEYVEEQYYTAEDEEVINGEKEIGDVKKPATDAIPHTVKSYIDTKIAEAITQIRNEIPKIWKGTEDEYSALSTYENGTVYFIKPNQEQNT